MELFEQQYFTEQYIILKRTEEGHENRTHVHHKYSMT